MTPATSRARYTYQSQFGSYGSGDGQFGGPTGVAVDGSGNILVGDYSNSRVEDFTSSGAFIRSYGSGDGQYINPYGLALDGSANLYVVDGDNFRVEVFSPGVVPEPSSLMMLGLGSLMAAGYGARRVARSRRGLASAA